MIIIHLFIHHIIFIEDLLCVRHFDEFWASKDDMVPGFIGFIVF